MNAILLLTGLGQVPEESGSTFGDQKRAVKDRLNIVPSLCWSSHS